MTLKHIQDDPLVLARDGILYRIRRVVTGGYGACFWSEEAIAKTKKNAAVNIGWNDAGFAGKLTTHFVVTRDGRRIDSRLSLANAKRAVEEDFAKIREAVGA